MSAVFIYTTRGSVWGVLVLVHLCAYENVRIDIKRVFLFMGRLFDGFVESSSDFPVLTITSPHSFTDGKVKRKIFLGIEVMNYESNQCLILLVNAQLGMELSHVTSDFSLLHL